MKKPNKTLQVAIGKSFRHPNSNQWVGCLTPVEMLALIDAGVKPCAGSEYLVVYAKRDKLKGISTSRWFYFYPNGLVMKD